MAKSNKPQKLGKSRKPEFEKIYQLIDEARTELERKRWEAVLKRLEENPPPKPGGKKS
jgi:hypothetical protein